MSHDSSLGWKVKGQIVRFARDVSRGLGRVKERMVTEMIYGMQASEDVKVSSVARALNEEIALIKTENRLCRNLCEEDLTERINAHLSWHGGARVRRDTVLAVDLGDVNKDGAKKMEHLASVRDGSDGEIVKGYWLCEVIGADVDGDGVIPLHGQLYSQNAQGFVGENDVLWKAIEQVSRDSGKRGIFALDRGGDRRAVIMPLLDHGLRFVIRQHGDRKVELPGGKRDSISHAARWCKATAERVVKVEREGYTHEKHLKLGSMEVRVPDRPEVRVWLVVIRGLAPEPILLLTNVADAGPRSTHAEWIADIYLTRWKCEEVYRFLKQAYHLEDMRVRSYVALRNTFALLMAVLYFVSAVIGAKAKLRLLFVRVCEKAKHFYETATFFHYTIADGIHRLLFSRNLRISHTIPEPPSSSGQLLLDFGKPFS